MLHIMFALNNSGKRNFMNIKGYKRIGFAVLGIILLLSVAGGLYSIELARQYGEEQSRLVKFEQTLVEKTRFITVLETELGYGGFIHNFKNFVLRHDESYHRAAEKKYDTIIEALDAYAQLPLAETERQAIDAIRATVDEYLSHLPRVSAYIAGGMTATQIDGLVRVDDTAAVLALEDLNTVWDRSFEKRFDFLDNVLAMEQREVVIVQMTIVGFMLFALALFWWIMKYEGAWQRVLQAQHASDIKYKEIIDNSGDAIITINNKGIIDTFNHTASKIFGYSEDEVMGQNVSMLLPEEERAQHDGYIANSSAYQNTVINSVRGLEARRKDGSLFPIELNIAPYHIDGTKCFVGMLRDITEKKKSEALLLNAMQSEIDAHRSKNLFIANMNHELRTPLNAIIGFSDMMLNEPVSRMSPEKSREYAEDINFSGHHLLAIISDLLDYGAIEEGKLQLEKRFFHLAEIVNQSLKMILQQAEENGVTVSYNPDDFDLSLYADARRVRQILLNVLSNSIKFTLKGGVISMACAQEDDELVLSVDDTGVGVAKEDMGDIFEPFHQARESHLTTKAGTGLGLPLSRTLVELHGGTMEFFSEIGKGSRVVIRLPNVPQLSAAC